MFGFVKLMNICAYSWHCVFDKGTCEICSMHLTSVNCVGRSEEALQRVAEQQQRLQLNEGLHTALAHFVCFHSLRDAGAQHSSIPNSHISRVNRLADTRGPVKKIFFQ